MTAAVMTDVGEAAESPFKNLTGGERAAAFTILLLAIKQAIHGMKANL